jgi:hypothetical protein
MASSNTGTLNVAGNFAHTGGTITESGGTGAIIFNGNTTQTYTSGGTVTNTINFTVSNGAKLAMGTSLLGGTSDGSFTLAVGGTLEIGDPAGITTAGASGNIRVTGGRAYNLAANYIYNGADGQVTGNGLPATVNNLTVNTVGTLTMTRVGITAITNNFSIATGAKVSLAGGFTDTANSLTLGGITRAAGTWGSSGSAAANKDDTWFAVTTGMVNVAATDGIETKLVYTSVPATGTVGTPFSVTVQAQDAASRPANVDSDTTITLSKLAGSGSLSGVLTGTIPLGYSSVTISTPVYSAPDTMTLTASAAPFLTPVTSGNIVFSVGPPTQLVISSVKGGTNPFYGQGFFVVVQMLDAGGNVTKATVNTDFSLSRATGTGALSGTAGGTITAGTSGVTINGVIYNTVEAGVSLTATRTSGDAVLPATSALFTVDTRPITVTAATDTKEYDRTTSSTGVPTITSGSLVFADTATWTQTFDTKDVGTGKTLTPAGTVTVGGANYTVTFANNTTGVVTAKGLTVAGVTAKNKVYDGNTTATLNTGGGALVGVIAGDTVTLGTGSAAGVFNNRNIGVGKTVTVSGLTIGGADFGNYSLTQPTTTADITAKALTVTVTKVYDGDNTIVKASCSLAGVVAPDVVTLTILTGTYDAGADAVTGGALTVETGPTLGGAGAANYTVVTPTTGDITPKTLTVTGITARNKTYDGTTTATLNTGAGALVGVLGGDVVTLNKSAAVGAFDTKNVGIGKTVTVSGLTLTGADAGNYSVTQPTTTADIAAKELTVRVTKLYDGDNTIVRAQCSLVGVVAPDVVTLAILTGTYDAGANVVTASALTVLTGPTLGGADVANYTVATPTTGDITGFPLTVTGITADNKGYDGNTTATLTGTAVLNGVLGADDVTLNTGAAAGAFDTKNVGVGKTVTVSGLTIVGGDIGKYSLTQPTTTADITAKGLTVTGITASHKAYNGNTTATLNTSGGALVGVVAGDTVTLGTGTAAGVFNTKNVGVGKTVTVSGLTLGGAQAGNYSLTQPTTTANITAKALTVTGITASNKAYDGTTTATLNTSAAALVGVVGDDAVTLNTASATGTFDTANPGTGKTVTVSGLTLGGVQAGNYSLTQPTTTANIAPAITSAPTATPNPATVGQSVQFTCAANPAGSTFTWDFGDGTTDNSGSGTVTHAYAAASSAAGYVVTVTVTNGGQVVTGTVNVVVNGGGGALPPTTDDLDGDGFSNDMETAAGTDPNDSKSTPFGGQPAGTILPLTVTKIGISLNFALDGKDGISLSGALDVPAGFVVLGQQVIVDVGGVARAFTLDAKGSGKSGSDTFKIGVKVKKGTPVAAQASKFQVKFSKGTFADSLKDEGLTGEAAVKSVSKTVVVTVLFNQTMLQKAQPVLYTAVAGKTGKAK